MYNYSRKSKKLLSVKYDYIMIFERKLIVIITVCFSFLFFHLFLVRSCFAPHSDHADKSGCESDMAEGIEETESNSGSAAGDTKTSMLGATLPCDIMSPAIGSLKREFDSYHSGIAASKTMSISPVSAPMSPHQAPENNHHHIQQHLQAQQQPINLKSEVSMNPSSMFTVINYNIQSIPTIC